jgi:hypothetical protein
MESFGMWEIHGGVGRRNVRLEECGRPNGSDPKLHGQGPRAEAEAARAMPACESRDAWRVTQRGS